MNKLIMIGAIIVLILAVIFIRNTPKEIEYIETEQAFIRNGLSTNTSKRSIDLNQILDGGPGKDGIPSINNPNFIPIRESDIPDDTLGILVQSEMENKFYPYNILVWHEIVNDTIDDTPISITFCPLCGSAIVFERQNMTFGVSGKLFESNLLMYDDLTESLWSQALGEAVVGDKLGVKLNIYQSDIITQGEAERSFPNAISLSTDTGSNRNYSLYPYGDYNESESLIFSTSIDDKRFPPKTLLYVVPNNNSSIAFVREDLLKSMVAEKSGVKVEVQNDGTIKAMRDNINLPGYTEMWFSWSTHHQEDGTIWSN